MVSVTFQRVDVYGAECLSVLYHVVYKVYRLRVDGYRLEISISYQFYQFFFKGCLFLLSYLLLLIYY